MPRGLKVSWSLIANMIPFEFLQGMTNNVDLHLLLVTLHNRFTISIEQGNINRIGDTKFDIQCNLCMPIELYFVDAM